MNKLVLAFLLSGFLITGSAFPKLSLLERFTNVGCGPCASINNSWYNTLTRQMVADGTIAHVIYNVDWPSATDPMFLLNSVNNNTRRGLYGVNSVPWIQINGVNTSTTQAAVESAVSSGNAAFSPFKIEITSEKFSNNVLSVSIKITRDSADVTTFTSTRLFLALTERVVEYASAPGSNGERIFYNVTRKMLPDAKGSAFEIPEPGQSVTSELMYIPTDEFLSKVNPDSIRVVAFIQNPSTKVVYQSAYDDLRPASHLNSAFALDKNLGAIPFEVSFSDYSTPGTSPITSWEWDFDNNGTIDATVPAPTHTFEESGAYSVSLKVSDGTVSHTRVINNAVTTVQTSADILVVNGIERATYPTEFANFYLNSGPFGGFDVDVWDLFGNQDFDYTQNEQVQTVHYFNRAIPNDILMKYPRVIWLGNNYGGDLVFYSAAQVLSYVKSGGNFLLATRQGQDFFSSELMQYSGVQSISGLTDFTSTILSVADGLQDMPVLPTNTRNQLVLVDTTAGAIPLFKNDLSSAWSAGFRIKKDSAGSFIYIAGRPYRYDNAISALNYDYIISNWMTYTPVSNLGPSSSETPSDFRLEQNYPNPFNPSTVIRFSLPAASQVRLTVFNALGEQVAELINGALSAGNHQAVFTPRSASGLFIYTLTADPSDKGYSSFRGTGKMILMK